MGLQNLETMFEFALMTETKPQSCDKFDSFRIMIVKKTISRWPDKFQDIPEIIETARVSYVMIKFIPFYNS